MALIMTKDDANNAREVCAGLSRDVKSKAGRVKRAEFFRKHAEQRNKPEVAKVYAEYIAGL